MNARVERQKFFSTKQYSAEISSGKLDKFMTKIADKARTKALIR